MSNIYIITVAEDKGYVLENKSDRVYIFENISGYEEELFSIIEKNLMSYSEIKLQVESWGGKIDYVTLSQLVNFYKKNNF